MTSSSPDAHGDASQSRRRATGRRVPNTPPGVEPVIYKLTWNPAFAREIEERAGALNLSVQNFVKRACLSVGETPEDQATIANELFKLHRLLANMANNINQIARVANSTKEFDEDAQAELRANFDLLRRIAFRFDAVLDGFDAS